MKRSIRYAALVMAAAMAMSACSKEPEATASETAPAQAETTVAETTAAETEATETEADVTEATEAPTPTPLPPIEDPNIEPPEGYYLVWHDEFDGDELDSSNWAGEYHRPGWVNNELQTYVVDGDNYFVEDGDLVIQPLTGTNDNGRAFYTSEGSILIIFMHSHTGV